MQLKQFNRAEWRENADGTKPTLATTTSFQVADTPVPNDLNFPDSNLSPGSFLGHSKINEQTAQDFENERVYEIKIEGAGNPEKSQYKPSV